MSDQRISRRSPMVGQLRWFVRLRWLAGLGVIAGALATGQLGWYENTVGALVTGISVLGYNAALYLALRAARGQQWRYRSLVTLAWVQILLDLICLTVLALWTGGGGSPLLGFFVFHMVIASLLLRRLLAYATAGVSWMMVLGGLWLTGQFPATPTETLALIGWMVMLLITVYLASNVTLSLRRHRRRVLRQRHRIRSMSDKLRRQSRAMAQHEKMVAMGLLAAGVAHEIANPLASMDSALQLIERKPERLGGDVVGKLREQIQRITQTVRQLTDFAHPGAQEWEKTSVDDVVARALQMLRFDHRLRTAEMDIARGFPQGGGQINARPHALEQVLVNLILNALDATAEKPKRCLGLRTGQRGQQAFIEISDNGHGIPSEYLSHVFEPFFTTKAPGAGTGLGLAISYTTVRDHGGTIEVDSTGEGTTFMIYLPMADGVSQMGTQADRNL